MRSDREPAFLDCVFRVAYCGREGGTAMIQLLYCPAKSRFQTGLILEAFWGRLKGLTGRRDAREFYGRLREITRDCVRLCEKFWAQHGRRGGGVQVALEAFLRRLKGLTGRSARPRDVRAFTGDYERLGQKTFHASRQTGGWVKAAGVVAAGGAQAQSGSKRCMNSCDALLCILSVRAVSIKVARIAAKCRVN